MKANITPFKLSIEPKFEPCADQNGYRVSMSGAGQVGESIAPIASQDPLYHFIHVSLLSPDLEMEFKVPLGYLADLVLMANNISAYHA